MENESPAPILFVCGAFPKSSEIAIFNQVTAIAEKRSSVDVLCEDYDDSADHLRAQLPKNVRLIRIPKRPLSLHKSKLGNRLRLLLSALGRFIYGLMNRPYLTIRTLNLMKYGAHVRSFWLLYQIQPFLKDKGVCHYQVIHAQFGPNGVRAVLLRDLGAIDGAIVTSFRGYDLNVLPKQNTNLYSTLFCHGDWFTTDSEAMKNKLAALGCEESRITRVPSSLSLEFWSKCVPDMQRDGCQLLLAGRLVECKGIEVAIRALSLLRTTKPNIRINLTIVGDGPIRSNLEQSAHDASVSAQVIFLGWKTQEELRQLMAHHHAFILPSVIGSDGDEESQGLVLQEAQAAGLPVIASRLGGIPEGLVDKKTGFLFTAGDHKDLADCLVRHIQLRDRWREFSDNARAFVSVEFGMDRHMENLETVYEKARGHRSQLSEELACV